MFADKTAEEKAAEWSVTPRYIQYLCREGKIAGAVKRAGSWFIPEDTPNPVKNTKADNQPFKFVGTKKKIFDNSIKLFTRRGYENVSINDIAESVGIRQSAVYNHFKSKQEILDTIYGFFYRNSTSNRPDTSDLEPILQTGSLLDIVTKGFIYEFDKDILEQMSDLVKIIIQRMTTDTKALQIFRKLLLEEGISFVESGLNKGVETGRLAPFDTHTVAVLINCVRLYTLLWWLVEPPQETYMKMIKDEQAMYEHIIALLTDLKPPVNQ